MRKSKKKAITPAAASATTEAAISVAATEKKKNSYPTPKHRRKKRFEKNVYTKQCVITIIGSLIALAVLAVPVDMVNFSFAFMGLPFIGDGSFFNAQLEVATGLNALANLPLSTCELIGMIFNYAVYAYVGILALNIVFSLFLIITRSEIARGLFKVLSLLFGLAMLAIAAIQLVYLGGFIGLTIQDFSAAFPSTPQNNGVLFAIATFCFAIIMIKRQFNWFAKWY